MALTWDATEIEGWSDITDEEWPRWTTLIFCTMNVGIGHITEKNAAEFYGRLNVIERLLDIPKEDRFTPEFVQRAIGLRCNVTDETRAQFLRRLKHDVERGTWDYNSAIKANG